MMKPYAAACLLAHALEHPCVAIVVPVWPTLEQGCGLHIAMRPGVPQSGLDLVALGHRLAVLTHGEYRDGMVRWQLWLARDLAVSCAEICLVADWEAQVATRRLRGNHGALCANTRM